MTFLAIIKKFNFQLLSVLSRGNKMSILNKVWVAVFAIGFAIACGNEENENENNSTNGNEAKIKSKKPLNYFVKGEVFNPAPTIRQNKYIINLPDEIKNNLAKGIAVLTNDEKAPKWVKVNLTKGELVLDPPKNVNQLDLTILTMDQDGNKISNGIKSIFNKSSNEKLAIQSDSKNQDSFVAFTDQIRQESAHFDTYGEDFLRRI